ncbi:MAG: T9SS type A sorting domain-containing protein [Bacteroidota bacterium]
MNYRLLCLFAISLIGPRLAQAQCLAAFPDRIQMYTCGEVEPLCVEEIPANLEYFWFGQPDTNCVETGLVGARSIRFTTPTDSCDFGPEPRIRISGAMGINLRAQNPSTCGATDGWMEVQIDLTDTVFYRLNSDAGLIATDTLVLDSIQFDNLPTGDYYLNIWRLGGGCSANFNYDLQAPEANGLDVEIFGNPALCPNNFMPLEAQISGGNPPFSYAWSNGDSLNAAIWPDNDGEYRVTVTDHFGCQDVASFYVYYSGFYWIDANITNAGCDGAPLGSIELEVSGEGPENLSYFWDDLSGEGPMNRYNLAPGTYQLMTINFNGCQEFWFFEVEQAADMEVNLPSPFTGGFNNTLCYGDTYNLIPTINNGTPPYQYSWSDGSSAGSLLIEEPGNYRVTITDQLGCTTDASTTIFDWNWSEPAATLIQPGCDASDGSISLDISLSYIDINWNTGAAGATLANVPAGNYEATLTFVGRCDTTLNFVLGNQLPELDILATTDTLNCLVTTATLSSSLNNPDFIYRWLSPAGDTLANTSSVLVDEPGTFNLYIYDPNLDCEVFATYELIDDTAPPVFEGIFTPFTSCENPATIGFPFPGPAENMDYLLSLPDGSTAEFTAFDFVLPQVGTYLLTGTSSARGCSYTQEFIVDEVGTNCGNVIGQLLLVEACDDFTDSLPVARYLVELRRQDGTGSPTIVPTNAQGEWTANLQAGSYLAVAQPYNELLYAPCAAVPLTVQIGTTTTGVQVGMTELVSCAAPRVDVNIPLLRRCFNNQFHLEYCNDGPDTLYDAQLLVELDSFLFYQAASVLPAEVQAFLITFDLGDLPPFACGQISIQAIVSCEATIGQSHCVLAQIPMATPCPIPDNWSGANIDLSANCDGQDLEFAITNIGGADMTVPLQYVIVEDGLMLSEEPIELPPLTTGEEIFVPVPANGSTYHLITNQEPNSPGSPSPTLAVEGCGTNELGEISLFYLNQLSLADEDLNHLDLECQNNQGAYDPNDKLTLPTGYGPSHLISRDQRLEYTIRFQNTGTDTAFQVVLRDTLAAELDLSSFRPGSASHDYQFVIDSNRVLEVTFPDIMLPDSFVAPLASQGAFQFSILPRNNLGLGTRIENRAGIYFDFNEVVLTNQVFHTIGKDFLDFVSGLSGPLTAEAQFSLYPNPAEDRVFWRLDAADLGENSSCQLSLFSSIGQQLAHYPSVTPSAGIPLNQLPAGLYYLHLSDANGKSLGIRPLMIR